MKIKRKTQDTEQTTPLNIGAGRDYRSPYRFKNVWELRSKYMRVRAIRGTWVAFSNIIKQYERQPYVNKEGRLLPNFGTLRGKVDKAMSTYIDFTTERERWATVKTDYGDDQATMGMWNDHISYAFQKYCLDRWPNSFAENMLAVRDMLLMSKGAFLFDNDSSCYPKRISIQHVMPDSNASMFADSFDTLFVHKRMSAVDLYRKIKNEEDVDPGWNREAVLELLRSSVSAWKSHTHESLFLLFGSGSIQASQQDAQIDLVYAYVREYDEDSDGNSISQYIFPVLRNIHTEQGSEDVQLTEKEIKGITQAGFLYYKRGAKSCMDEVVSLVAHGVCENFYEEPSLAQMIYTVSKTYDQVMNRVLDGIEDNMRVYLRSDSPDTMQKLQRMRHGNYQVLMPGVTLQQDRINRPIQESMAVLQKLMLDTNQSFGDYSVGEQQTSSTPKTARQASLDYDESKTISTGMVKIFNCFHDILVRAIYKRWVEMGFDSQLTEKQQKNFKLFTKYLTKKQVPKEAYLFENVTVASVALQGAGSTSGKLQGLQVVQQALSIAAATPGEQLVKRQMIGAAMGTSNIDAYLPPDSTMVIQEDSLIGLENDALSAPDCNPGNVQVIDNQLHMRHIPKHLADANLSMQMAMRLYQSLAGMPKDDAGVYLLKIQDILLGIDNKLSHSQAHAHIASRDKNPHVQAALAQAGQQMQAIQQSQAQLERAISQAQKARADESQQKEQGMQASPEMQHALVMYKMKEEHAQNMLNLEMQTFAANQAARIQAHGENALHKQAIESTLAQEQLKTQQLSDSIKLGVEATKAAIKKSVMIQPRKTK